MRLIDAEELIKVAEQGLTLYSMKDGNMKRGVNIDEDIENCYAKYTSVKSLIQDAPTAYNVDKVVEELELLKKHNNRYDSYYDESMYRATEFENTVNNNVVKKAIEIVKRGGLNDR